MAGLASGTIGVAVAGAVELRWTGARRRRSAACRLSSAWSSWLTKVVGGQPRADQGHHQDGQDRPEEPEDRDRRDKDHPPEHVRCQQQSNPNDGDVLDGQEDQQRHGGRGGQPRLASGLSRRSRGSRETCVR